MKDIQMHDKIVEKFFDEQSAQSYERRFENIIAIRDNLYLLTRIVLMDLPATAKILCVGVGTGTEMTALAQHFPQWQFVGVDPSHPMLVECKKNIENAGISDRCDLVHGYLQDMDETELYDGILCFYVAHFIKDTSARQALYDGMYARLKPQGSLVNVEICGDDNIDRYDDMVALWERMHNLNRKDDQEITVNGQSIAQMMADYLLLLAPQQVESALKLAGFHSPLRFFQSLLMCGWYAKKG